jgi:5-methylcytosine-specific restriction endonuclease McrA
MTIVNGKCTDCGSTDLEESQVFYWAYDENGGQEYTKDVRYCGHCFDRWGDEWTEKQQNDLERKAHQAWAKHELNKGNNNEQTKTSN